MLSAGHQAPEFSLYDQDRRLRSLQEWRGRHLVLAFYPGAFTSVCQREMCAFRDALAKLERLNAQVVGISVDSPVANKAFAAANNITFPLLSDYTREVSRRYGGVQEDFLGMKGYTVAKRAVFVVDDGGVVRYVWVSDDPGQEPPYAEVQSALAEL